MEDEQSLPVRLPIRKDIVDDAVARIHHLLHNHPCNQTEAMAAAYLVVSQLNAWVVKLAPEQRLTLIAAMSKLMMELADPRAN